jgi:hypothetical protein
MSAKSVQLCFCIDLQHKSCFCQSWSFGSILAAPKWGTFTGVSNQSSFCQTVLVQRFKYSQRPGTTQMRSANSAFYQKLEVLIWMNDSKAVAHLKGQTPNLTNLKDNCKEQVLRVLSV